LCNRGWWGRHHGSGRISDRRRWGRRCRGCETGTRRDYARSRSDRPCRYDFDRPRILRLRRPRTEQHRDDRNEHAPHHELPSLPHLTYQSQRADPLPTQSVPPRKYHRSDTSYDSVRARERRLAGMRLEHRSAWRGHAEAKNVSHHCPIKRTAPPRRRFLFRRPLPTILNRARNPIQESPRLNTASHRRLVCRTTPMSFPDQFTMHCFIRSQFGSLRRLERFRRTPLSN